MAGVPSRGLETRLGVHSRRLITSPENKCCYTRNVDWQASVFAISVPERGETVKLHDTTGFLAMKSIKLLLVSFMGYQKFWTIDDCTFEQETMMLIRTETLRESNCSAEQYV